MINLLDNVLKFTPDDGWIGLAMESCNGCVRLRIADSGPGIDNADLPFIFERFFRGRCSRGVSGNGLGLSLCREIGGLHRGEISAANRPGGAQNSRLRYLVLSRVISRNRSWHCLNRFVRVEVGFGHLSSLP